MNSTLTRRSALTAAAAVLVGGVAGLLYGRHSDAAKGTRSNSYRYHTDRFLVSLATLPADGGLITSGVVLIRSGAHVHAYSASCTHLGCQLNRVADGRIFCPCHGSIFDARTGQVLQGPASTPLPPVPVTVMNGGVYTT